MDKQRYFEGIASYKLLAKHEVGQNFLIDTDAAKRIVDTLDIQKDEKVIEIGSGAGSLTYFLAESEGKVDAIDIDESLVMKLQEDFKDKVNVQYGNGVKWDYSPYDKIIGNLPYYITSLLIERALLCGTSTKKMVFMVQKEAGERLLASVGNKDYGPLPILIALLSKAKREFTVRRNSFAPAPHVDSVVLSFTMLPARLENVDEIYKFCSALFLQRRKTLFNNLKNYMHYADDAREALAKAGLNETIRPEQVTPEQFLSLYRFAVKQN